MGVLGTNEEESPASIKPNIELGFIGRNKINNAADRGEDKECECRFLDDEANHSNGYKCYTFEEAIKLAGHGKFHYYVFITVGISLLSLVAELIGIGYTGPSAKCDLKFTTAQQGVLNSIAFFGFVCSSHLWGFLADTWGRRKALRLSLLSTFIFSALSSISISISMLIATRFFVGFCVAGIQSSALPYLGEFHSNETRARAITFASMCMTLAVVLMSLMSWFIIPMKWSFSIGFLIYSSWRFNILCIGFCSLTAFLLLGFLPESPKFLLSLGKQKEVLDILKQIHETNGGTKSDQKSIEGFPVMTIQMESIGTNLADTSFRNVAKLIWKQTWPLFLPPHLRNMMLISFLSFVLYGIAHALTMWLPHIYNVLINYVDESVTMCEVISKTLGVLKSNQTTIGDEINNSSSMPLRPSECTNISNPLTFQMMLILGIFLMFVYVSVGFFIKWISIRTITTFALFVCGICGTSIIWSSNFYATYILLTILLSCGNFASLIGGLSQDLFPTNLKAMAVCFIFMFGRIGSVAGSNLIGLLIGSHCNLIFAIYGTVLFTSALLCISFLKTSK